MFVFMNRERLSLAGVTAGMLLMGVGSSVADVTPYDVIVDRNPFGLKPPPPPPDPSETAAKPPPPAPPATVELTGITSILSSKRALLEIVPGPGKPMIKPILGEGERMESVEVVSINVEKNEVTIRNGTLITNLTFKVAKSTPSAPPPPPAGVIPPPLPGATPAPAQTSYNNNQGGNRSVMVGGGSPVTPANTGAPAYGGVTPGMGTAGGAPLGNDGGFRSIPSRNIRTPAPQSAIPQMSPEEQVLAIEANEDFNQKSGRRLPPLPPTVINPNRIVQPPAFPQ